MSEPPNLSSPPGRGLMVGAQLFVDGEADLPEASPDGSAGPIWYGGRDHRLTDASLTRLVQRIEAVSVQVREVEAGAEAWERLLDEVHARMYARIVEVEERAKAAETREREERARAETAEERLRTLEQWVMKIAQAMTDVEGSGQPAGLA